MSKRVLSLIIAMIMAALPLVSCASDKDGDGASTQAATASKSDDPMIAEIDKHIDDLAADNDFNGRTFTWIGGGGEAPSVDEETGDVASDAFYFRQRDIEEKFGIDWINHTARSIDNSGMHATIENVLRDVMAGTNAYDAGYGSALGVTKDLLLNNVLIDVSDYDVIDLEKPWWPSRLKENYNINGAIFFLNGPIVSTNYKDTYCVMVNKQVMADYNIPELYSVVKKGEWTFDRMFKTASVIPTNENGSGSYRYGHPNGMAILIANGETLTKFDDTGKPYVDGSYSASLSDICDKMSAVFGDNGQTVNCKGELTGNYENLNTKYGYENFGDLFIDDKILFYFGDTGEAAGFRSDDVEFGILPMPKKDEKQENYISYAGNLFNAFVPKSTKDEHVTDVILEAMAALGLKYIKPANYDNILKIRTVYDTDSVDMIDLIFETKTYDLIDYLAPDGSQNDESQLVNVINCAIQESSNGIASKYNLQTRIVNRNISVLLAEIESNP